MQNKRRTQNNATEKTVEIDLHSLVSVGLIVLMGVLLLISAVRFAESFLSVSRFEIVGECPYEASDLAAGAEIKKGDKLYRFDRDEAEKKLLANCAYLEEVKIKTSFPNKIKFVVKSHTPVWYVEISGDFYALDKDLNVLEETKNEARLYESNLIKLTLPSIKTAIVDDVLTFGEGEEEIEQTKKIMETILSSSAFPMISGADIDNRYDIHFEFDALLTDDGSVTELDDVFKVSVGGYSKLDVKLEYILRAIAGEDLDGAVGGSIDVSDGGEKVSIRPSYTKDGAEEDVPSDETEKSEETDKTEQNSDITAAG